MTKMWYNIGDEMIIRCHASNRFLAEIDIESWYRQLEKIGIKQQTPLKLKIPCRTCKCTEHYELYEGKLVFRGSEKHI
jgi:hypothetical protein